MGIGLPKEMIEHFERAGIGVEIGMNPSLKRGIEYR